MLHTNVEELVWKPLGLEVLESENGIPYTDCDPQDWGFHMTLTSRNLDKIID